MPEDRDETTERALYSPPERGAPPVFTPLTARILESMSDAFVLLDRSWNYLYVNRHAAEIFGRDARDLIGKHIWTEFPEGVGQPFHLAYERAMAEQVAIDLEEYYPPWNRWFRNRICPSQHGLAIFFSDITATRSAELARQRLASILEVTPDVVAIARDDGTSSYLNGAARRLLQVPEGAALPPVDLVRLHTRPWQPRIADEALPAARRTGVWFGEAVLAAGDGTAVPMLELIQWHPGSPPDGGYLSLLARDMTERQRAEIEQRRENEARAQAERMAHLGFWRWHVADNRVTWSDELYRIYGLDEASFGASFEGYLERVHPGDRAAVRATIEDAVRRRGETSFVERIVRPDGSVRHLRSWGKVDVDDAGEPVEMFGTCLDITEMLEASEEQRRVTEQLRHAQKMDALGRLAAGVAHDLNNLLMIMTCSAQLLGLHRTDDGDGDLLEQIDGAAARAAALTRQLLALSRQQARDLEVVDVNAVVDDLARLLERTLPPIVHLETRLAPGLAGIRADKSQIEQVVLNLAVNGRDAMPSGGLLTLATRADGDDVVLEVRDTGVGMSPEVQARIFEPFFTTKGSGRGTGLGLATVYGIVAQSGGRIEVESIPGVGSLFRVRLPRTADIAAPRPAAPAPAPAPAGGETVLLVEDDDAVRRVVRELLTESGYRVLDVRDPDVALQLAAEAAEIRLLLADVHLPRMSGIELARRIRALRPELKVLFMSGRREEDDSDLPGPILEKPFGAELLAARVREQLDT